METASLGAGRSGGDHGRSMHQCKAPRNPQTHPAPRSPSASRGLGVVARGGGPGGGLWHGKRQGVEKDKEKKYMELKKPPRVCRWHDLAGLGGCGSVSGCWAGGNRAGEQLCRLP